MCYYKIESSPPTPLVLICAVLRFPTDAMFQALMIVLTPSGEAMMILFERN